MEVIELLIIIPFQLLSDHLNLIHNSFHRTIFKIIWKKRRMTLMVEEANSLVFS